MTRDEHEDILRRLTRLEQRQTELGARVATLALLLSEHEKAPTPTRKTPPGTHTSAHTERWRAMQRLAFEVGAEFGKTRADLAEMRKRYGG